MAQLINKENMERQISEMWNAVSYIPVNDPDRDHATQEARSIEAKMREQYRKQEQLRDAAPDLLEALILIYNEYKELMNTKDKDLRMYTTLTKVELAIEKATE